MIATDLQTPRRGSKPSAQGIALGTEKQRGVALQGQKHSDYNNAYALSWTLKSQGALLMRGAGRKIETYHLTPRAMPWAGSFMSFQDERNFSYMITRIPHSYRRHKSVCHQTRHT